MNEALPRGCLFVSPFLGSQHRFGVVRRVFSEIDPRRRGYPSRCNTRSRGSPAPTTWSDGSAAPASAMSLLLRQLPALFRDNALGGEVAGVAAVQLFCAACQFIAEIPI